MEEFNLKLAFKCKKCGTLWFRHHLDPHYYFFYKDYHYHIPYKNMCKKYVKVNCEVTDCIKITLTKKEQKLLQLLYD